jgi:hypothetical protein
MKLKLVNIISILIVIIIVGSILTPWSQQNNEQFAVYIEQTNNNNTGLKTLNEYIQDSSISAFDYNNRITALENKLKTDGPLNKQDYDSLISNVQNDLNDSENYNKNVEIGKYLIIDELKKNKINELTAEVNSMESQLLQFPIQTSSPNSAGSIKSVKYAVTLSIKKTATNPNNTKTVMIFLNNGCLTYHTPTSTPSPSPSTSTQTHSNSSNIPKYYVKHCELQNPNQKFIVKEIKNNICVISPESHPNTYLKIDNVGISFVNYIIPTPTPSISTQQILYPDDLLWFYSDVAQNTCNKMESQKITLK